jgi:ribosomal protein L11 methyltransferase
MTNNKKCIFADMNTIKLKFEQLNEEQSDLVAALLSNENIEGFEHVENDFFAYFTEINFDKKIVDDLLAPFQFKYTQELIAPQNWNESWEKNFEPIRLNEQVGVRAHFHPPFNNVKYDIEITPKMSFGTGHHATTQLMLAYGCETDFTNKTVFDFGCGTGVLAIFASLKQAKYVVGIDDDPWSVENALENCARNHCNHITISIDDIETFHEPFDIILANINLNILIQYKNHLKKLLNPQGGLFLSGLMTSDKEQILAQYADIGFTLVSQKQQKEWIALELNLTV